MENFEQKREGWTWTLLCAKRIQGKYDPNITLDILNFVGEKKKVFESYRDS